ncbi:hypothetical protein XA68_15388 [Ophiocordyceps unilateralis]|uniref:BPL/LPL catalytic domain-containing protein n=1 Tax=Ophiocordyceps unilateralis TaxID=268505 RepID=A0A2A9P8H5_OPHUN|nr:hypothetical protein XA68_15388 [Ophiocordyceps unilateralis]
MWRHVARTPLRPRPRAPDPKQMAGRSLSVLAHRHLVGIPSYEIAHSEQELYRRSLLCSKARRKFRVEEPLKPLLLSFEPEPTFSFGRRQDIPVGDEAARLLKPLRVDSVNKTFKPAVVSTFRGGLTSYHGPGQLVLWPVVDLRSSLYPQFKTIRCYANLLQGATVRLLDWVFSIPTVTVENEPGVWVVDNMSGPRRKIASMGVHLRRHVAALGVAINVHVSVTGGEHVNPWARFVPCGLEDRLVTSVAAELGDRAPKEWDLSDVASRWAAIFDRGLIENRWRYIPQRPGSEKEVLRGKEFFANAG